MICKFDKLADEVTIDDAKRSYATVGIAMTRDELSRTTEKII